MKETIQIPQGDWKQVAMGWKNICLRLLLMDDEEFKAARIKLLRHVYAGRDFGLHVQNAMALPQETYIQQAMKSNEDIAEQRQRELPIPTRHRKRETILQEMTAAEINYQTKK